MKPCVAGALFLLLGISAPLFAQAVSGSITGAVLDATGAAVPNAKVTITNNGTGVTVSVNSNEAGYYNFPNLIAGAYKVEVSASGFRRAEQTDVTVSIGSATRIDMHLEVGNLQDTVTVTGTAPLLRDEKVNLGGTISTQELHSLPTFGRNPTALAKLQPGVVESPGQQGIPSAGGSGYFSVNANGQRAQLNYQLLDGVDDTEGVGGGAPIVPAVDALEEYTVNTSNYDVEFGQVAGAMTIMTTKSGSNSWHGSGYEYNRVNALYARNSFTEPVGPGHYVWNQFGGTLGGPIQHNRFFVFTHYQGIRQRSGGNIRVTMPTAAFRRGDFSALLPRNVIYDPNTGGPGGVGRTPFPNNMIPANRINPVSQKLLALMPLPNLPGDDQNFLAPNTAPINQDNGTIRADYNLNESNRLFIRYTRQNGDQTSSVPAFGRAVYSDGFVAVGNQNSLAADFTHVFRPNLLLETRFGWSAREWKQDSVDQSSQTSAEIGIPGLNDACPDCGGLVNFRVGGPVGGFTVGDSDHSHQVDNFGGYNFVGVANWTHGSHNVKFGADANFTWRDRRDSSSQGNFGCGNGSLCDGNGFAQSLTGSPEATGSGISMASFLLGRASTFQRIIYARGLPLATQKRVAAYIQDTWKVTRKLTLNLGVRWDYIGYPRSPDPGGIANFNFSNAYTIISNFGDSTSTANVDDNFRDFGPRVGFAYRITDNTVIRSGFARTYSIGFFGANFGAITNDWPNATRQKLVQNDPYTPVLLIDQGPPKFVSGFDILKTAGNPGQYPTPLDSASFGMDRHNPDHSVDQWNLAIQHQFLRDFSVTAAYVGNAGRHVFYRVDYNAAPPGPGTFSSRRRFGAIGYNVNANNQSNQSSTGYHALQLQAEKRYGQGLLLTTALTWSKSYDFGAHNALYPFNSNLDRALQDNDRALVLVVGHVWDLPIGAGRKYLNRPGPARFILGGFQFSGITRWMSGTPFTPIVGNTASLNSDCCTLRPNRIGNGSLSNPSRARWFDTSAFAVPGLYQYGSAGRNILRGPTFATADLSLAKAFNFTEQKRLELRWDVFNALNRTNLGNPVTSIDSSIAGRITGLNHPMRRQQLGLHFLF